MELRAIVVGAGIAGLASAISLRQAGWSVTVLERSPSPGEVGAGFAASPNAVAALRGLGFGDHAIDALGARTRPSGTWDERGRPVLTIRHDPATRASVELLGVHRRRMHAALWEKSLGSGVEIVVGTPVTDLDPGRPEARAATVEGRQADLVVGADGMRSAVRTVCFPGVHPVYSGYSSWRAIVPRTAAETTLRQFWGPHAEFGSMPVSEAETYWYGYVAMPERTVIDDELAVARERFTGWADDVQRLLARTPADAIMRHDVHHLPAGLPRYHCGRVVMIGDAAHGFLPTMGQGAATALEDGLSVGRLIGAPVAAGGSLSAALADFDGARRPRCRALARASLATARFGSHLGAGRRQAVRNRVMRWVPTRAIRRGAQAAWGWTPPEPAAPQEP